MKKHGLHYFSFLLVFLSMVSSALADWINLTGAQSAPNIAEIHVEDDYIRLVLKIYVGDLDKFVNLLPEDFLEESGIELLPIQERMKRFSEETFQFLTQDQKRLQAEAIASALIRKKPDTRQFFEKNLDKLKNDLLSLCSALREIVRKNPSQPLIASHPVYDYLARGYGLNLKSVHWEPNETPNTEQWVALQKLLPGHPAKWMIWEGPPKKETVERLKSLGINSLV